MTTPRTTSRDKAEGQALGHLSVRPTPALVDSSLAWEAAAVTVVLMGVGFVMTARSIGSRCDQPSPLLTELQHDSPRSGHRIRSLDHQGQDTKSIP